MTKTIPVTNHIWDTDYISDNWETESMTIFVTWQLRVTLDSIRNSCDVFNYALDKGDKLDKYKVDKDKVDRVKKVDQEAQVDQVYKVDRVVKMDKVDKVDFHC